MRYRRHDLKADFELRKACKMNSRNRQRLAEPATFAAIEATTKVARERFGGRLAALAAEIKAMLAVRSFRDITGAVAVWFIALKAQFDGVAIEHKHFAEADLSPRLDPDGGGGTVDA